MKIAIVEDEERIRREFRENLERYSKENSIAFEIMEYSDGDGITNRYTADFDIILMDIEMPFVDGMAAAEEIRQVDSDVTIIFITNAPQYAIKGYKVGALDYILKPVSYYAFSETIRSAIEKRRARTLQREDYITINVRGGIKKLEISQILYAEVIDHELFFHMADGEIRTRGTIRELEQKLSGHNFFKCNKGCLINLSYVEGYQKNDVIVGPYQIQISRSRKKPLLEAIHEYFDGVT